jgi:hypothetical protein
MSILKNEPIFPFAEGDYTKPHHIIVEGTNEEIGFDLATLAKNEYDCKLEEYADPVYGAARREYFRRNWPAMYERSKGVLRAFGLSQDDCIHDASSLPYDWYDVTKGLEGGYSACSANVLPIEKSETGEGVFTARNHDMCALPLYSGLLGKTPPKGAHNFNSRPKVLELRPERGYRSILVGGHDLMSPMIDGINEKGLYFSIFADPDGVGEGAGPISGGVVNGLTNIQLGAHILNTSATIEEVKKEILCNRVIQVGMCVHVFFVDKKGKATIFEIDKMSQGYLFVDRKPGEPLFITNHPIHTYPDPSTFPDVNMEAEHNTFVRMKMLIEAYAGMKPPFKKSDSAALTDVVHSAFVDDKKAQASVIGRTLINTNCDLSKPEISVRFYLGDVGPTPGTNHMQDRMSEYFTFGF